MAWPKWAVAGVIAAATVLVAVWTPLLKARVEALAARTTRSTQREAQAESALRRLPTRKGKFRLVEEVTDRALLGIHEAIPLPAGTAAELGLSEDLPLYVPRDVDSDLRTALQAASRTGGFMLLVGPAAAGKTRCAYEALRSVLPRWQFLMPGDAPTLNELVAGGADLQKSVVWLDEIQRFLTGPDRLTALTMRRLLADTAHPVVLIGTVWPDVYDRLRSVVSGGREGIGEGFDSNSREVLELARRFSLGAMSEGEWARAEELSPADPRIAQASRHRGHAELTQLLSAAPELVQRWEQGDDPFGKAVISAAVAARRCGHPETIPSATLKALSEEYLTGLNRAAAGDTWFLQALEWACRPVHNSGGIAPLHAYGKAVGAVDGYQVSDLLVDHASASAVGTGVSISFWGRLIDVATPQACFDIGYGALHADMNTQARSAWERVVEAGDSTEDQVAATKTMFNLAGLLETEGDVEGARTWYTRAAEAGHSMAMNNLGFLLRGEGDVEGARLWWIRGAEAGETKAMNNLGRLLSEDGDLGSARMWWTRGAEAGDANAMASLGVLLQGEGDAEGARTWFGRVAEAGDTNAMAGLGLLLQEEGDAEGARTWFALAAEAGDTNAMVCLGALLRGEGDVEGARTWYTRAAEAGDTNAMNSLGALVARAEDYDAAHMWWTRSAEAGDADAMLGLGALAELMGDVEGARTWYTRAAEAGNADAADSLAMLRNPES